VLCDAHGKAAKKQKNHKKAKKKNLFYTAGENLLSFILKFRTLRRELKIPCSAKSVDSERDTEKRFPRGGETTLSKQLRHSTMSETHKE